MIGSYNKNKDTSPKNVLESIIGYLEFYSDTSNKKLQRLQAVSNATELLEFIHQNMRIPMNEDAETLVFVAFQKILIKTTEAKIRESDMISFKDEIGFLRMLSQE